MGHSCCNDDLKQLFQHALALQKSDDLESARDHYQHIVEKFPDHIESHYNLAFVQSQLQEYAQAITHLKIVLEHQPRYAPAYFNLAINHLAQHQTQEAMQALERVLQYDPSHINAQHLLGCLYLEQKNYQEAQALLEDLNKRVPNDAEIQHNLGLIYLGLGEYPKAIEYFNAATEHDANSYESFYNLGVIYGSQQQTDKAIEAYKKCLAIQKDYYPALFNLGRLYHDKRELDQAKEFYHQALALAPDNPSIRYLIAAIDDSIKSPDVSPPQYVMELFDSYANHYDQAMQQQLQYATPKILRDTIAPWLAVQKAKISFLDLGCGTGLAGQLFKDVASEMIGIDLSANMLLQAQLKNVYSQLETAEILTYLRRHYLKFDMIVAADVFLYFGDLREIFSHLARMVEIHGVIGFSIESQTEKSDYLLQPTARFAHNPAYIERLAQENNLKIIIDKEAHLRMNRDEWIDGRIFWLQK
jgi:predicted TPR repeat methyltransferase